MALDYNQQLEAGMERMRQVFERVDQAERIREIGGPSEFSQITDRRERFTYALEQARLATEQLGVPVSGYDWLVNQPGYEPLQHVSPNSPAVGLLAGALAMLGTQTRQ